MDYESLTHDELIARLREAEETLEAIRTGEVDAVVIAGPSGQQVYTLENAIDVGRSSRERLEGINLCVLLSGGNSAGQFQRLVESLVPSFKITSNSPLDVG